MGLLHTNKGSIRSLHIQNTIYNSYMSSCVGCTIKGGDKGVASRKWAVLLELLSAHLCLSLHRW